MAEMTADTRAILDRLKAEGDLIRNSGTNSLRAMNVKLDKFDGLFQSINENLIEQTKFMARSLGIASDAAERARNKEQFEEVSKSSPEPVSTPEPATPGSGASTSDSDRKIDAMGDAIASALSLKNIALAGAGAFVGYNLLKGFIDEKTGGGFTEFENNFGSFAKSLSDTGFAEIKETATDIRTSLENLTGPDGSLTRLTNSMESVADTFERIANMGIWDVMTGIVGQIGAVGVGFALLRAKITNMRKQLEAGTRTVNGQTWWQRALGIGRPTAQTTVRPPIAPDIPERSPRPQGGDPDPNRTRTATPRLSGAPQAGTAPSVTRTTPTAPRTYTGSGRGNGQMEMEMRQQRRADLARLRPQRFSINSAGRLVNAEGRTFVSDQQAIDELAKTLDPKYSKVFKGLVSLFKKIGIVLTVVAAYEIYVILVDDENYPTDEAKIQALSPVIGAVLGGLGGAALGALAGAMGGPWGSLIGGIAGGIIGSFGGSKIGFYVAKWAFDQTPNANDEKSLQDEFRHLQVRPMPNGGHDKRNWLNRFGETHLPDGTPRSMMPPVDIDSSQNGFNQGSQSTPNAPAPITDRNPFYFEPYDSKRGTRYRLYNQQGQMIRGNSTTRGGAETNYSEFQLLQSSMNGQTNTLTTSQASLASLAAGQTPSVVVVGGGAPPVQQFISYANGGNQVQLTQASIGGGGGNGSGAGLTSYGLTQAFA